MRTTLRSLSGESRWLGSGEPNVISCKRFRSDIAWDAVEASLTAERGPFYDALKALCALAAFDLGRQVADAETVSDDRVIKKLGASYNKEVSKSASKAFQLADAYANAKRQFGTPNEVLVALESLAPEFTKAFKAWEAAGSPSSEPSFLKRLFSPRHESKEGLLKFARNALFFFLSTCSTKTPHIRNWNAPLKYRWMIYPTGDGFRSGDQHSPNRPGRPVPDIGCQVEMLRSQPALRTLV